MTTPGTPEVVPGASASPVVLVVPHASETGGAAAAVASIKYFHDPHAGAFAAAVSSELHVTPTLITNRLPRYEFDPERARPGCALSAAGYGTVFERNENGEIVRDSAAAQAAAAGLQSAYDDAVASVCADVLSRHAHVLLVTLKTYTTEPQPHEIDPSYRPGLCIGTDTFHSPAQLSLDLMHEFFDSEVNAPFAGAYVPGVARRQEPRVQSLTLAARRDWLESEGLDAVAARVARRIMAVS